MSGLRTLTDGRTTVIVTRAVALAADRVIGVDGGRVVQNGPPAALALQPGPLPRMAGEQGVAA